MIRAACRVSVLGLGVMGLRHARVLASLPEAFELVGAFDVSHDVQAPAYVRRLESEADAIGRADAVVVATPIEAHAESARRALAAGRHVLVEKPLCDRADLAEELGMTASRCGVRLYVGHSERFNPVVRALARLLGEHPVEALDLRRIGPARRIPHGVLLNLGVHDFDLACYLGGGDMSVRSAVGRGVDGATEDVAHVFFESAAGVVGHIHVDRTRAVKDRAVTALTDRWVFEGDLLAPRLVRTSRLDGVATEMPLSIEEPLVAQALAFAASVRGSPSREIATGADGARAVKLAEIAAAQCRLGCGSSGTENLSLPIGP